MKLLFIGSQKIKILDERLFVFCSHNFDRNIIKRINCNVQDRRTLRDFLVEIEYSKAVFKAKYFGIGDKRIEEFSNVLSKKGIELK